MMETAAPPSNDAPQRRKRSFQRQATWGLGLIGLVFVGVGGWAAVAPLSSAAIAPGKISVEGDVKTIQHLEGGIVRDIKVRDGDLVAPGQLLLRLDDTQARADRDALDGQIAALDAIATRLEAERDELDALAFDDVLLAIADVDAEVDEQIATQRRLFETKRDRAQNQEDIELRRIDQKQEEIKGLTSQLAAQRRQAKLIGDELRILRPAAQRGVVPRRDLLERERRAAEIAGEEGRIVAEIARAKQSIAESEVKIIEQKNEALSGATDELQRIQAQLTTLRDERRAAEDILRRVDIIAPRSGVVVGLAVTTPGGVIDPGEDLMQIVPQDENLVVSARISPTDIDAVRSGLVAEVRLLAFNMRRTPTLEAEVKRVSADLFEDDQSGESYYEATIELNAESLAASGAQLYTGMPVEAMIVTGERTALDYIAEPIFASANRAFREE